MMTPPSIRARLILWAGGLTLAALAVAWVGLSALLADFVDRRLNAELTAAARAVMAVAEWDDLGAFTVIPPPPDPRFETPLSGWYWQVSDGDAVLAGSPSLIGGTLTSTGLATIGPAGKPLVAFAENFTAPGDSRALNVTVTLPKAEAQAELAAIRAPLVLALALLGAALLLAQVLAVRAGLVDLTRFAAAVARVRGGQSGTVPPPGARELAPLAAELERLIAANRAQIDRARAHAGDLAHALKTPLAVLGNRAGAQDAPLIARMERLITWHLKRAQAAAAEADPTARTPVAEVLEDVALVLRAAARPRDVMLDIDVQGAPIFRGDAEDLAEMAGNLVENAVKWAKTRVQVSARPVADQVVITVADDGPGIAPDARAALLRRGARLDENSPGAGLGLAIVTDRAALYGGALALETAAGGGLLARLSLPGT